jgi:hypothetical protein
MQCCILGHQPYLVGTVSWPATVPTQPWSGISYPSRGPNQTNCNTDTDETTEDTAQVTDLTTSNLLDRFDRSPLDMWR